MPYELYYDEQRDEAQRRAAHFRAYRLPKFMGYFGMAGRAPSDDDPSRRADRGRARAPRGHRRAFRRQPHAGARALARLKAEGWYESQIWRQNGVSKNEYQLPNADSSANINNLIRSDPVFVRTFQLHIAI